MTVGLFFGSFNPVHHGHLIIAQHLLNETRLDQVWMVVSPQNPFKLQKHLLNEYHRLHLLRVALENSTNIKVVDIEFHLPKPSYTINTLIYLEEKYPDYTFSLIMGSDSLQNLDKWKNSKQIMDRYPIYVYRRPGFETFQQDIKQLFFVDAPLLQISATHIRELIQKNKSIRFLVPDAVLKEIEENNYYKLKNPADE